MEARVLPEIETLTAVLERHAAERPGETAFTFMPEGEDVGDAIDFDALNRRSRTLAAVLQERGLAGERALLAHPSGIDFVVALLGCQLAGVVAIPANLSGAAQGIVARLEAIAADAEVGLVLAPGEVVDERDAMLPGSPLRALDWFPTDRAGDGGADAFVQDRIDPGDLALFQYTSGSTGMPRGVMLTHANLYRQAQVVNGAFGGGPGEVVVSWLPLFHDMGLITSVLCPLVGGYHSAFMPPLAFLQRPMRWLEAVDRFGAKISGGPNFAYELCVRKTTEQERERLDLSSWGTAFNSAEPVHADTLERFAGAFECAGFRWSAFAPCYGLAEATCGVACTRQVPPVVLTVDAAELGRGRVKRAGDADEGTRRLVSSGPVVPDHAVRVVDPEDRRARGPDEIGELWIEGPCVGAGYWNRPEDSEATFEGYVADVGDGPFLRTGDLGFVADGHLFITGRLKDILIVHGMNHYPQDIERSTERAHPGLRPGCGTAFAVPVAGGERIVVVQEVRDPDSSDEELAAIDAAIRAAVSRDHALPVDDVVLVPPRTIPKTSSGKVQRRQCRAAYEDGALAALGAAE